MVQPVIKMLASDLSHLALDYVWQESGFTQRHGFELVVHVADVELPSQPFVSIKDRGARLLDGTYAFLSGLHHQTYVARARGDKRFVYLAQAQNDWDDRVIAAPHIKSAQDIEGHRMVVKEWSACVVGNLERTLTLAGADPRKIDFTYLTARFRTGVDAVEGVASGEYVAGSVDIPFDRKAEKRGLQRLSLPSVPVIHNVTVCANREWVRQNEETSLAFLRSMIDVIHFWKTQPGRVCEILERTVAPLMGIEGDDEIEHLQAGWADLLSPKPYPHPLAIWNVYNLDVAPDPGSNFIGPMEIWDTSLLRTIDDEGYIDELYGGIEAARNPAVNPVI
jgi:hypothetical protein